MATYSFMDRLKKTMESRKLNQSQLAKLLGSSRQVIASYLSGRTRPDAEMLFNISKALKVSSDYLLGASSIKTTVPSLKVACEFTGLNENAISNLSLIARNTKTSYKDDVIIDILNQFLSSEYIESFIGQIYSACYSPDSDQAVGTYLEIEGHELKTIVPSKNYYKQNAMFIAEQMIDRIIKDCSQDLVFLEEYDKDRMKHLEEYNNKNSTNNNE